MTRTWDGNSVLFYIFMYYTIDYHTNWGGDTASRDINYTLLYYIESRNTWTTWPFKRKKNVLSSRISIRTPS